MVHNIGTSNYLLERMAQLESMYRLVCYFTCFRKIKVIFLLMCLDNLIDRHQLQTIRWKSTTGSILNISQLSQTLTYWLKSDAKGKYLFYSAFFFYRPGKWLASLWGKTPTAALLHVAIHFSTLISLKIFYNKSGF